MSKAEIAAILSGLGGIVAACIGSPQLIPYALTGGLLTLPIFYGAQELYKRYKSKEESVPVQQSQSSQLTLEAKVQTSKEMPEQVPLAQPPQSYAQTSPSQETSKPKLRIPCLKSE
ncbi:MAG: hypothetical protein QW063_00230 [Candidatus Nanoarchaeia archaeon]